MRFRKNNPYLATPGGTLAGPYTWPAGFFHNYPLLEGCALGEPAPTDDEKKPEKTYDFKKGTTIVGDPGKTKDDSEGKFLGLPGWLWGGMAIGGAVLLLRRKKRPRYTWRRYR